MIFRRLQQRGFYQWQEADCQPRRLDTLTMRSPEEGQPEETYLESQVHELRAVLQSTPEERIGRWGESIGR